MKFDLDAIRIQPGKKPNLSKRPTRIEPVYNSKEEYHDLLAQHVAQLSKLQQIL